MQGVIVHLMALETAYFFTTAGWIWRRESYTNLRRILFRDVTLVTFTRDEKMKYGNIQ